jgi:hypothetical protein
MLLMHLCDMSVALLLHMRDTRNANNARMCARGIPERVVHLLPVLPPPLLRSLAPYCRTGCERASLHANFVVANPDDRAKLGFHAA